MTATVDPVPRAARTMRGRTVRDALVRHPKLCGPDSTVADVQLLLRDDHVHAALLVATNGTLVSVVERADLTPELSSCTPARTVGRLEERTAHPDSDLEETWEAMRTTERRRLAVVDDRGVLLGLLCLKRTRLGFCSDEDVRARNPSRRPTGVAILPE